MGSAGVAACFIIPSPVVEVAVPDENEKRLIAQKIETLKIEHRDLDEIIARLIEQPGIDQLQLRRLKKRKLLIKDILQKLESQLIPDMDA